MTMPNEQIDTTTETAETPAVETPTPEAPAATEPTGEDAALAAMDKAIEDNTPEAPESAAPAAPKAEAAHAKDGDAAAAEPAKGTEAKPVVPDKPEPDPEVEAEIKTLRLKEKGAERFRNMASEIKAFAPVKAALEKAGIKDAATFEQAMPQLVQRSKDFEDMVGMVSDTGATPQMYSNMLDYMKDAVAAANGDTEAAQRAYERSLKEVAAWGKLMGMDVPGIVDPLEGHADLQAEVENGDLSRARAVEIVQQRNAGNLYKGRIARDEQGAAQEQAVSVGKLALNTLESKLKGIDADYDRKRAYFLPTVKLIVAKLPPEQWAAAAEQAYAEIPALPAAPAPVAARPTPGPVHGGARMTVAPVPKNPMEALEMGIAAAGG